MIQRSLLRQSRALCSCPCLSSKSPISRSYLNTFKRSSSQTRRAALRYYSTSTEAENKVSPEASNAESSRVEAEDEDPSKKELDSKNREIIELKVCPPPAPSFLHDPRAYPDLSASQDKYLRSVADFRNLQDRTKRDVDSARSFAISRFAHDLVESVDNLDRALGTVPPERVDSAESNKDLVNLYQGLKMTETILMQTLKKHGLERFDPSEANEPFNPNLHEATFQTKVEGKEDGSVFMTQQKGFLLNGRVVRVCSGPKP